MKTPAFLVAEIVPFVVSDKIDNCAVRQGRRFVEHQTSFFDASTQRAHVDTVRRSSTISKLTAAASAISSAIETEKSETDDEPRKTTVNRVLRQVAESERVGDQRRKSEKSGKTDSRTPTLSESLFRAKSLAIRSM